MSKYRIGNYDTGEPKFCYLRRWHHQRFPTRKFRKVIWIAKCIQREKYEGNKE